MKRKLLISIFCAWVVSVSSCYAEATSAEATSAVGSLGFDMIPTQGGEGDLRRTKLNAHFQERLAEDRKNLSFAQVEEIERVYQIANTNPKSVEAIENLKKVVANPNYQKSNRIGCALLYLATTESELENAEDYLKKAIETHGNSWYGDGVQVASYARFLLAKRYWKQDKKDQAKILFDEIRAQYPEAIDHRGELLVSEIPS